MHARWLALALALAACHAPTTFQCDQDSQCDGLPGTGTCQSTGYCSYVDSTCSSNERYDSYAGGGLGGRCVGDNPGVDGGSADGSYDATPGCSSWNVTHFDPCTIPGSTTNTELMAAASPLTYDTTTGGGTLTDHNGTPIAITAIDYAQSDGTHAALWVMDDLTIDSGVELDVIGTKPLIVASWGTISIVGNIDAGSHHGGRIGAGSNPSACAARAAGTGGNGTSGNGGGGGGGYQGSGATGGVADSNCTPTPPACEQPGGVAGAAVAAPPTVLGGCDGGDSGASGATFAAHGHGGGAILLAARSSIAITGQVLAGGGGGDPDTSTTVSTGGGGGGAGGFIGLEAASVVTSGAVLAANGGAGGAGADLADTGTAGGDGGASASAAAGGVTVAGGTNGGDGSSLASTNGGAVPGAVPVGGGGGGGGGAGFVLYWSASFTPGGATISPAPAAGP